MKKKFTFLIAALMLLTMILPWKALGQERGSQKSTLTFTAACGGSGTADDGAEWTVTSDGTESTYDKDKGIHYGTGSAQVKYIQLSTSDILGNITKVVVNASTASGVSATVGVTVGESNFGGDPQSLTSSAADYTFEGSASGNIVVLITKPSKATKALYCKSIEVTYTPSHTLTYSATTGGSITSVMNGSTSVSSGGKVVEGTTLNIEAAAESGYVFAGWTQTGTGNSFGNASNLSTTFTMGTANATITANFEETSTDPYFTASDVILAYNVTAGSIAYTVNNPVQGGVVTAEITGGNEGSWLSRGDVTSTSVPLTCSANNMGQRAATVTLTYTYNTNQTVTKDVTVTQAPAEFTITFHGNGGKTAGNATEYTQVNVVYNTETALTANTFTRDGYLFNNWNTEADAYGYSYNNQANVTLTESLHLYAQWTTIPTYTLVTDVDDIVPGAHYLIASSGDEEDDEAKAMGAQGKNNRSQQAVEVENYTIVETEGACVFVISGFSNNYTIYDAFNTGYLYAASSNDNYLKTQETNDDNGIWSIEINSTTGEATIVAQGTNTRKYMRYNSSSGLFSCYAENSSIENLVYIYRRNNDTNIEFHSDSKIAGNLTVDQNLNLTNAITIDNGGALNMGSNTLSIGTGGSLTIEDGGQLVCSNSVAATVKKTIVNANSKAPKDHWYTISSPVKTGSNYVSIGAETTVNLTSGSYDMFAYDEEHSKWLNQKSGNGAAGFDKMYAGQGYMYRNGGAELSFVGNTNTGAIDCPLSCLGADPLTGFNLIGNPYTHNIAKGSGKAIDNANLSTGCYVLSNSGTWATITDGNEIKPNQGVLVETSAAVDNFQIKDINYVAPGKYNNDNLKFSVENAEYSDAAYAWFDKGIGLTKINHRNDRAPMLYIPQNGHNYAIAIMSDDTKVFGLNFKAATMGQYTLSYKATGEYNYIHVIDRLTGEDVDMLLDDKYTFVATPNDQENRFIVKLGYMPDYSEGDNDIFVYQTGSEILVSGSGELQIFDVTGRKVMTTTINGAESVSVPAQGVYIFRLVGNEIKTQKIVVR